MAAPSKKITKSATSSHISLQSTNSKLDHMIIFIFGDQKPTELWTNA